MADLSEPLSPLMTMLMSRLSLRDTQPDLFADLERQLPLTQLRPNAAQEAQGNANPQQINQVAQAVQAAPAGVPSAPAGGPIDQGAAAPINQIMVKLMEDINQEQAKSKKPIGPDLGALFGGQGGAGGILGTGLSPSTALMYALGGLITSRLPQEKALALTMQIGGLPGEYEKSKAEFMHQKISSLLSAANAATAGQNVQLRSLELQQKASKEKFLNDTFSSIENRLQSGIPLTQQERMLFATRAHRAGIDPNVTKELFLSPDLPGQLASLELAKQYAKEAGLGEVSGTLDMPGGQKITIGGAGAIDRNMDQRTRTILAGAQQAGTPMTINEARAQAQKEELELARAKQVLTPAALEQKKDIQASGVQVREKAIAEKRVGALIDAEIQIKTIFGMADQLITAKNSTDALVQAAKLGTQSLISATQAGSYKDAQKGLVSNLSRSLGGEVGVLTDIDINRFVQLFPTFSDSVDSKDFKKVRLQGVLDNAFAQQNAIIEGKSIDIPATRKKLSEEITKLEILFKQIGQKPKGAGKKVE